ncbi:class II fructose-bisphosphate aldolase [Rhizobium sp. AU243]|uniref:class II fructose-bisphosphate aldolase n=1 Tax=Rhizobium sp. AU243 TaxID=2303425 RepID=UPI0010CB8731|nr:class II fructose-bisphosphate aldolase [Rhizobium sp. AU243]TKV70540.1 fructose-bisphosphate aldolase class II [Rhizobium sp. AU243]
MPLISLRQILDHAAEHSYGLPAFNVTNLETIHAVLQAADKTNSPVILQASQSARTYMDDTFLKHLIRASVELYPHLPICFHQDHGSSPAVCERAMNLGFSSVMMDGSLMADGKTPSDFSYNVQVTAETVRSAHQRGISVEGEIGVLGSLESGSGEQEDGHGFEGKLEKDALLTDPEEAARFFEATGVDALAVAIGTSHGAYKFSKKPTSETLAMSVIEAIHERLPNTHLVMHGASSVPEELQQLINEYGGEIQPTYGVPLEEIVRGIKSGVRKVNIDTDLRMAFTGAVRRQLSRGKASFDIRAILKPAVALMKEQCEIRFEMFGCTGQASKITPLSLEEMAQIYFPPA